MDVCLSCLMQNFRINDAMANFFTLEDTANAYARVMGLWLHYQDTQAAPESGQCVTAVTFLLPGPPHIRLIVQQRAGRQPPPGSSEDQR